MRTVKILILIVFLTGFHSCTKKAAEEIINPEVETYIELVKNKSIQYFKFTRIFLQRYSRAINLH